MSPLNFCHQFCIALHNWTGTVGNQTRWCHVQRKNNMEWKAGIYGRWNETKRTMRLYVDRSFFGSGEIVPENVPEFFVPLASSEFLRICDKCYFDKRVQRLLPRTIMCYGRWTTRMLLVPVVCWWHMFFFSYRQNEINKNSIVPLSTVLQKWYFKRERSWHYPSNCLQKRQHLRPSASGTLSKFSVKMLQDICVHFELESSQITAK